MADNPDKDRMSDIAAFEERTRGATTLEQLSGMLDTVVRQFGFRWFALFHNVDLARHAKNALMLTTYPAIWVEEVVETRLYVDGPIHVASGMSVAGLAWDRIDDFITPDARQLSILKRGRDHGLVSGFTMPLRMDGEPNAVFTVARKIDAPLTDQDTLTARLLGTIAFERARLLLRGEWPKFATTPLSPRQIDCIDLVAQGKSDWEIGQILGLTRNTVHEYVEAARRRYGVRRRTQLVLRAVRDGHLNIEALV